MNLGIIILGFIFAVGSVGIWNTLRRHKDDLKEEIGNVLFIVAIIAIIMGLAG